MPYSETWNLGVQHVFDNKYTAEVRYAGTRGIHLNTQFQINRQAAVTPSSFLPTYFSAPTQATLDASGLTLAQLQAPANSFVPAYYNAGFTSAITAFGPYGQSIYHGLQAQLSRSFTNGLQFLTAYTWSHNIDNSTADFASTYLTPRRPQDSQNFNADYGTSALDRRHRLTAEVVYDLPFFKNSNYFMKNIVGNWEIAPVYTFESPEDWTPQSGVDSNINGDSAPDRTIFNASGVAGSGSGVTALCTSAYATSPAAANKIPCGSSRKVKGTLINTSQYVVGYQALNPNAQYVMAGVGALATASRNTVPLPHINNVDVSLVKRVNITEGTSIEFSGQFLNVFNHAQYIAGSLNTVNSVSSFGSLQSKFVTTSNSAFNNPKLAFSNNPRNLILVAKFIF